MDPAITAVPKGPRETDRHVGGGHDDIRQHAPVQSLLGKPKRPEKRKLTTYWIQSNITIHTKSYKYYIIIYLDLSCTSSSLNIYSIKMSNIWTFNSPIAATTLRLQQLNIGHVLVHGQIRHRSFLLPRHRSYCWWFTMGWSALYAGWTWYFPGFRSSGWWLSPTPLKNMKVNWDDDIPNVWKNRECSKPPTSHLIVQTCAEFGQISTTLERHVTCDTPPIMRIHAAEWLLSPIICHVLVP
jgi:hypothetical protein